MNNRDSNDTKNLFRICGRTFDALKESITLGAIVRQGAAACLKRATNKEQLFSTVLSLVGGYLSKKALVGNSKKGSERIMGYAVQFLTTQFLSKITNK
jgi:hypothetical protein